MTKNKSKINLFIVTISLLLIIAFLFYLKFYTTKELVTETQFNEKLNVKNSSIETKNNKRTYDLKVPPLVELSEEVISFNNQLLNDWPLNSEARSMNPNNKLHEVAKLESVQRESSQDVIDAIEAYFDDFAKNQIQIENLYLRCKILSKRIKDYEKRIFENKDKSSALEFIINSYYFHIGLSESGICRDLGSIRDPFYRWVSLARKGDKLSQLVLIDRLWLATKRGILDPYVYPLDYKDLRDEALMYLQKLASTGVTRAAMRLAVLYGKQTPKIIPTNKILEYYYSYLSSIKYNNDFYVDLDALYDKLSDKEKLRVDQMIKGS